MRLILLVFFGYNLFVSTAGDLNNMNMKVLMACPALPSLPSLPSSCRNIKSTMDREVITLSSGMKVMCDTQTDGGGWIIIQRRINGKIPFYRGWEEYRYGFGDYSIGEFYLGNKNIYQLTSSNSQHGYELRIDLKFNNASYYAKYSRFSISGESEFYRLRISGYSGNAGDNLELDIHFSTHDKLIYRHNCAGDFKGGWWYNNCYRSNLNGIFGQNMYWHSLTGQSSVTFSEMKIREVEL